MSDIIYNLRRQNFPDVLKTALLQLEKCYTTKLESTVGYGDELADQIVDEFIFQQSSRKGFPKRKLSAMQELQIMEHLLQYFSAKGNEVQHQQVFKALFGGANDDYKLELLGKLLSMAIGMGCANILNAAAVWMQLKGCTSEVVCILCRKLVDDYFVLAGEVSPLMHNLPSLSSHFTCNFVTAVTGTYNPAGTKSGQIVPEDLLKMLSEWLSEDSRLCLATLSQTHGYFLQPHRTNLWTSPTKPNTQTPTPGLVRWCVQAPLNHMIAVRELNNKYERSKDSACAAKVADLERINQIWSRLHLSVLETILQLPTINGAAQLELFTLIDMNRILKEVFELYKIVKTFNDDENLNVAADRLVQILQISLATGAFRCSLADLRKIVKNLPPSQLTPILERQHLSTSAPQMHNVG